MGGTIKAAKLTSALSRIFKRLERPECDTAATKVKQVHLTNIDRLDQPFHLDHVLYIDFSEHMAYLVEISGLIISGLHDLSEQPGFEGITSFQIDRSLDYTTMVRAALVLEMKSHSGPGLDVEDQIMVVFKECTKLLQAKAARIICESGGYIHHIFLGRWQMAGEWYPIIGTAE